MKRLIAAGILLIVVISSYFVGYQYIDKSSKEVSSALTECEKEYKNNQSAEKTAAKLHNLWMKKEKMLSFFVNHDRIDEIELEISSVKVYASSDQKIMFAEHTENLKVLLHQLKEDTEINVHSIF